ncbi:hypothetical protein C8R43DRAFT_1028132 [Mycena crocata]|nr:hypothetical protein C8R43DRAFT_1028132 [Mycena crocata]
MAPRTRNGGRARLLALGVPINTTGLPALPVEILHEITSHLTSAPVPCKEDQVLASNYLERSVALRALAETCTRLRSVFLVAAWQHLEVCASTKVSGVSLNGRRRFLSSLWFRELSMGLARELVRQMEIVTIRNPTLAQEVRIVTVVLSDSSAATIIPEFFAVLNMLPRLETLQILRAPYPSWFYRGNNWVKSDPFGENVDAGHVFPTIRTLTVCASAFEIIACCSNLQHLIINFRFSHAHLKLIASYVSKLRVLSGLSISGGFFKDFLKVLPNLTQMPPIRTHNLTPAMVNSLAGMRNLRRIDLVAPEFLPDGVTPSADILALVATARQILRGSVSGAGGKCVTVRFGGEDGTIVRTYTVD